VWWGPLAGVWRRRPAAPVAVGVFAAGPPPYNVSGIAAIHPKHPLQRHLRDASVVAQHAFLSEAMYDGAGAVLMGVDPFPGFP
jgi:indole-3-acetate monooxygenase